MLSAHLVIPPTSLLGQRPHLRQHGCGWSKTPPPLQRSSSSAPFQPCMLSLLPGGGPSGCASLLDSDRGVSDVCRLHAGALQVMSIAPPPRMATQIQTLSPPPRPAAAPRRTPSARCQRTAARAHAPSPGALELLLTPERWQYCLIKCVLYACLMHLVVGCWVRVGYCIIICICEAVCQCGIVAFSCLQTCP